MTLTGSTVTAGGHANAHDPGIDIMRMSMNPDLGIFAPLKMLKLIIKIRNSRNLFSFIN
jgi:hypothetical protein